MLDDIGFGIEAPRRSRRPKSHQPCTPPVERLLNSAFRPVIWVAKLATGLAGLITLLTTGRYMMKTPEIRPTMLVTPALIQPLMVALRPAGVSLDMLVLLDRIDDVVRRSLRKKRRGSRRQFHEVCLWILAWCWKAKAKTATDETRIE